jgi:hypothetical protein
VVATESNERAATFARFNAALNGAEALEVLDGDPYGPVSGDLFDLVVSDRPRLLSLTNNGAPLPKPPDAASETMVNGAGRHLRTNGWGLFTCQWSLEKGESADEHIERWTEGIGCDAMVFQSKVQEPDEHITERLRDTGRLASEEAKRVLEQWSAHLDRQGVAVVGSGFVVLRKSDNDSPWISSRALPAEPTTDVANALPVLFWAQEWLESHGGPGEILATSLRLPPSVLAQPHFIATAGRWVTDGVTLSLAAGMYTTAILKGAAGAVFPRSDGKATLDELFEQWSATSGTRGPGWGAKKEAARRELEEAARQMVGTGFLLPPAE